MGLQCSLFFCNGKPKLETTKEMKLPTFCALTCLQSNSDQCDVFSVKFCECLVIICMSVANTSSCDVTSDTTLLFATMQHLDLRAPLKSDCNIFWPVGLLLWA